MTTQQTFAYSTRVDEAEQLITGALSRVIAGYMADHPHLGRDKVVLLFSQALHNIDKEGTRKR